MGISNSMHESLSNTPLSWICSKCEITDHYTRYSCQYQIPFSAYRMVSNGDVTSCSKQSFGDPTAISSPKHTQVNKENGNDKILEINCDTSYILLVHIQCHASIYTLSLCRGHSWRVWLAKQETLTPTGHLVSPLVCRGP